MSIAEQEVAIDDSGLLYHDPSQLATTIDMEHLTVAHAEARGASPCSQCFNVDWDRMKAIAHTTMNL